MHRFTGKWITNEAFAELLPRDRFYQHPYKMLAVMAAKDPEHNAHVLFRKKLTLGAFRKAVLYISADDYYKLYINGVFVCMGPASSYKWAYRYNRIDVTKYLKAGENVIAVHTYYQGLINRYLMSGDLNHGMICDLEADGKTVLSSDESFLTANHTGYRIAGTYGYDTAFREDYDARAAETGFEKPDFDDSAWKHAKLKKYADYKMVPQKTKDIVFERVEPKSVRTLPLEKGTRVIADFGELYAGYLNLSVRGKKGTAVTLKSGQELLEDGSVRYVLRTTNVEYLEHWTLGKGESVLDQYDYKPLRYVEIDLPEGAKITDLKFTVRHYPFELKASIRPALLKACRTEEERNELKAVWDLAVNTMKLGAQETMFDCLDRERGTYLADVGLAIATHALLSGDVSLLRGLVEDAFNQLPIIDSLGAGTCCSLIHNTAEYPLVFLRLLWFSYCVTGDRKTLLKDYDRIRWVLDTYARDYEKDGLIGKIDKWCVVEWPQEYRDGYDADLSQKNEIEPDTHVVLSMHYYRAVCTANRMAKELGLPAYRDERVISDAMIRAFYDKKRHLFRDRIGSEHVSYIGNLYPMAFGVIPDEKFRTNMDRMMKERKIAAVNEFGPFPILEYYAKIGEEETLAAMIRDPGAWLRMIEEGATVTWEAWGIECKWNTSLFHNSLAYVAIFMADADLGQWFS
ncbi:MAG: family 78 glycoside hydrolase catalytic domain [Lachnospiraceae bacterium]|nr:family 78 glycoside hydrolase catalytic domain [Lachnospiraceae bacterium]